MNQFVQPLADDPFIHDPTQKTNFLGGTGQETPGDAAKLITQGKKMVKLFYDAGRWNVALNDGTAPQAITTNYTPLFRVRAVKLYTANGYFRLIYDMPQSQLCDDYFVVGLNHSLWITRVYLTDANITQGEISLIG